ncbi:MAG: diguanylate cyclase [Pseudomonadota bacterium]
MNTPIDDLALPRRDAQRGERVLLRSLLGNTSGLARFRLPDLLEDEYARYHHQIALTQLRSYWPLVVAAVLAICVLTFASGIVTESMRFLVVFGFAVMFSVISVVIAAALLEPLNPYLGRLVGMAAFLGLLAMHIATLLGESDSPLRSMAEYGVVFITVATFSISNLPFRQALFWTSFALLGLVVVVAATGLEPDWQHFYFYCVGAMMIGAILGFTQEIRERTVFLQERLLALEKKELDVLTGELAMLSREDALTGLANRRHFDEVLTREWAACLREGTPLNLLFIDVDHFKRYNDHYGHQAGDGCLARVGRVLGSQALRGADFVARYGGEEFVAMFPRTNREGLETIAQRIVDAVDELAIVHEASEVAAHVTVSVGVASLTPARSNSPEQLVRMADAALYRAKELGRHRYVAAWEE